MKPVEWNHLRLSDVRRQLQKASISEETRPQLNSDDAEDEEDEEAEQEHVAQHGQRVQEEHHEDPHAWKEMKDIRNETQYKE